ncbi:MAG: hypothetical protein R6U68_05355 [Desulfobacteraceae bacterium]
MFEVPQALDQKDTSVQAPERTPERSPELSRDVSGSSMKPFPDQGETREIPLGRLFAARSGDKGGNANLGVWAGTDQAHAFLSHYLTCDCLKTLLPDLEPFEITRYDLPNLRAVNFYIKGLLGHGVAASMRSDPQAKTLGEYLRAKIIPVPLSVLEEKA